MTKHSTPVPNCTGWINSNDPHLTRELRRIVGGDYASDGCHAQWAVAAPVPPFKETGDYGSFSLTDGDSSLIGIGLAFCRPYINTMKQKGFRFEDGTFIKNANATLVPGTDLDVQAAREVRKLIKAYSPPELPLLFDLPDRGVITDSSNGAQCIYIISLNSENQRGSGILRTIRALDPLRGYAAQMYLDAPDGFDRTTIYPFNVVDIPNDEIISTLPIDAYGSRKPYKFIVNQPHPHPGRYETWFDGGYTGVVRGKASYDFACHLWIEGYDPLAQSAPPIDFATFADLLKQIEANLSNCPVAEFVLPHS